MARAVRISRSDDGTATLGAPGAPPEYRSNTGALTRAGRLFAIYLVVLIAIYAVFVGSLLTSSGFGSGSAFGPALLTILAFALLAWGFFLTLARTPRGLEIRGDGFILIEFSGGRRSYPRPELVDRRVENRYPSGWLSPSATEMVSLEAPGRPTRRYLLDEGLVPARPSGRPGGSLE